MMSKIKPPKGHTRYDKELVVRTGRREFRLYPGDLLSPYDAAERVGIPIMAFVDAIQDGNLKAVEVLPPKGQHEDAVRRTLRVRYLIPAEELVEFVRQLDERVAKMTGKPHRFEVSEAAV